ncbi:MAG: hypothetical protein COB15_14815, partial [Flavobacteriales bacterium]
EVFYNCSIINGNYVIKDVEIRGGINLVVDLFIKYWETKLQISDLKDDEIAHVYLVSDYVGVEINSLKKVAKITIRANK